MAAVSHIGFVCGRPRTECNSWFQLRPQISSWSHFQFPKYIEIFRYRRCGLKLSILVFIFGGFVSIFTLSVVLTSIEKDSPCTKTRRLSHKAWKSIRLYDTLFVGYFSLYSDTRRMAPGHLPGQQDPTMRWLSAMNSPVNFLLIHWNYVSWLYFSHYCFIA